MTPSPKPAQAADLRIRFTIDLGSVLVAVVFLAFWLSGELAHVVEKCS